MKALYTTHPGSYGLADRPKPTPANGEALVKVVRSALCHTDVDIRAGTAAHVKYPFVPGHEFSGIVENCGPDVRHVKPGDRVAAHTIISCGECTPCRLGDESHCHNYQELGAGKDGGFAEYCAFPARHAYLLPEHVSYEDAALVEPLANAVAAVNRCGVRQGERVVVIGPGPIGLLAMQVARLAHPAMLVLVGTREARLSLGKRLGATHTVNVQQEGAAGALSDLLAGGGADCVIECSGSLSALNLAMDIVGWRGRVALEGTPYASQIASFSPLELLHARAASLIGVCGWSTSDFVSALRMIAEGLVQVKPIVTHNISLDDWEHGFDLITKQKDSALKVAFAFDN